MDVVIVVFYIHSSSYGLREDTEKLIFPPRKHAYFLFLRNTHLTSHHHIAIMTWIDGTSLLFATIMTGSPRSCEEWLTIENLSARSFHTF